MLPNQLRILPGLFAVSRFESLEDLPPFSELGKFWSISRTSQEISLVCQEKYLAPGGKSERGWRIIQIVGPLEFSLTGVLESILRPLARADISIFALSTYDTDYVMVKKELITAAKKTLEESRFTFI